VKRKSWIFWLGLAAVLFIVASLPAPASAALKHAVRDFLSPLQSLAATAVIRIGAARDAIAARGGLPEQNLRLNQELVQLQNRLLEFEELQRENHLLRQQLGFVPRAPRTPLPAEVIARDISGWWQTLRVHHGGAARVLPDQAVISSEGLVGKVIDASPRTADILLITDPACRVAVHIGDSGAFGILSGQGLSWRGAPVCRLDFINKNISIQRGDRVYSSGLGGVFPKGLLVGTIESVSLDENGLHQHATVIPAANLSDLPVVFILTSQTEGRP
jgi:rod shape-determining protein MreC